MFAHPRHFYLVGGDGLVEVFNSDFLKRQSALQLRKASL